MLLLSVSLLEIEFIFWLKPLELKPGEGEGGPARELKLYILLFFPPPSLLLTQNVWFALRDLSRYISVVTFISWARFLCLPVLLIAACQIWRFFFFLNNDKSISAFANSEGHAWVVNVVLLLFLCCLLLLCCLFLFSVALFNEGFTKVLMGAKVKLLLNAKWPTLWALRLGLMFLPLQQIKQQNAATQRFVPAPKHAGSRTPPRGGILVPKLLRQGQSPKDWPFGPYTCWLLARKVWAVNDF